MKAIWKDQIIAESDETIIIENNHYFPEDSVNKEFLNSSNTVTHCPWKGRASYFNINIQGVENRDAAWYYTNPKSKAKNIKNYVAFWKGVEVIK